MGARERWFVERDGILYLHEENDGWTFMRKGPQAVECPISPEEAERCYPDTFRRWVAERQVRSQT
jgi:hypothetical protein